MGLASKDCIACSADKAKLTAAEINALLPELNGWSVDESGRLVHTLPLDNFKESLRLAVQIGDLAEKTGHHPDLLVRWGELKIIIWTHAVNALTENDFILAAKIDELLARL